MIMGFKFTRTLPYLNQHRDKYYRYENTSNEYLKYSAVLFEVLVQLKLFS